MLTYKVVELNTVTDEELEAAINKWIKEGWPLDGILPCVRRQKGLPWPLYFSHKMIKASS